ncbi:MAG: hypothetical protein HY652_03795 [Acidobacteria bacterium]|nr:hypothetical protein [Acidobacteriota bacterium]
MRTFLVGLSVLVGLVSPSRAQDKIVPEGTRVVVRLFEVLSSRSAAVGDRFLAEVAVPVSINDEILIPVKTLIEGEVTHVRRPGRIKGKAELGVNFDTLLFPTGARRPASLVLVQLGQAQAERFEQQSETIGGAGSKGQDVTVIGSTAAGGATIGSIADGSGKGAAVGAGVGAAAGVTGVLLTRGREVLLPQGTILRLEFKKHFEVP